MRQGEKHGVIQEKRKWWKCGNILNKKVVKENKRRITVNWKSKAERKNVRKEEIHSVGKKGSYI